MEKAQWEKPVDGGAISERGRLEAAKNQVVVLRELMRVRGCKEEFVPNPALLEQGQVSGSSAYSCGYLAVTQAAGEDRFARTCSCDCERNPCAAHDIALPTAPYPRGKRVMPVRTQVDFLAAKALSAEEQETARKHGERMAALTRRVPFQNGEGEPAVLQLFFRNTYKTNGGHMFDITVRRAGPLRVPPCRSFRVSASPTDAASCIAVLLKQHCGIIGAFPRIGPTVLMSTCHRPLCALFRHRGSMRPGCLPIGMTPQVQRRLLLPICRSRPVNQSWQVFMKDPRHLAEAMASSVLRLPYALLISREEVYILCWHQDP